MAKKKKTSILVTGDFVLDHHVYEGNRHDYSDQQNRGVKEVEELGGAALVHYLLAALEGGVVSYLDAEVNADRNPVLLGGRRVPAELSAYAVWKPFGPEDQTPPQKRVWRTEEAMGFGRLPEKQVKFRWPPAKKLPKHPKVVVLSDGGMGFRDDRKLWPSDAVLNDAECIVLKTSDPVAFGKLWKHLMMRPDYVSKLVVIAASTDLRKGPSRISAGLSWDATIESLLTALTGDLKGLTECRHLLVALGTEGGLWLDYKKPGEGVAHLVFDPTAVEGEFRKPGKGTAFGTLSCVTAAVAWHLARGDIETNLETALEGGLSAMNDLLDMGHGRATVEGAGYPAVRLAKAIKKVVCRYARTVFEASKVPTVPAYADRKSCEVSPPCWSVMHEALRQQGQVCPEPAWTLAEQVAQRGPIAIGSLPHLAIGNLMSADRQEIESLRVLSRLIRDYKERKVCKKPLAIGVFGPPGAGKSFAVKEIAQTLIGKEEWMEFNLSQFKAGTEDLIGAFHQIRDRVLKGQVPVAFFDEFDSRDYMWLQYLLAPIQDGAFQEGQITHPIGKCIFIFAGGTSWTFKSFGPSENDKKAYAEFKMVKGPDFRSRLDGFLDILGPNRRRIITANWKGDWDRTPDCCDIFYPVRRAFVIRSEFGCQETDRLEIDAGLLRGMLRVEEYTHGARSLSKVIEPLKAARPRKVYSSLLPPRQQLELHLGAEEFLAECGRVDPVPEPPKLEPVDRDAIAVVIHKTWRRLGKEQGWLERKNDVPFKDLSNFYKESNRAAAARMADTLAVVGLTLQPGKSTPDQREIARLKIEYNLEMLAEAEHSKWMEWHLERGFVYSEQKVSPKLTEEPKSPKTHHCLLPYLKLSDVDRSRDRDTIRHYPEFASNAHMKIVAMAR